MLAALAVVLTGCPSNDYVVQLTPHGNVMERDVWFSRADGTNSQGVPNYQGFDSNQLAAITLAYPAGDVSQTGNVHRATGKFAGQMPGDVGGSGSFTNITTVMGSAGFYLERFRGNDDIAGLTEERLKAADHIADLMIGWSRMELGGEAHYRNLRRFLDTDFRRDLKNASLYVAPAFQSPGGSDERSDEKTFEAQAARLAEYLAEREYVGIGDVPDVFRAISQGDEQCGMRLVRRFVARKLELQEGKALPKSFAFLANGNSMAASLKAYLATTDEYRVTLRHWQETMLRRKVTGLVEYNKKMPPPPDKPDPMDVITEAGCKLVFGGQWDLSSDDTLEVRLALPTAPLMSNGEWNETNKLVVWKATVESRDPVRLPVLCYASWVQPDEAFQRQHFGRVVLWGTNLEEYCLWRGSLEGRQGSEWDGLLGQIKPGDEVMTRLYDFTFSHQEGTPPSTNGPPNLAEFPRSLIESGLTNRPPPGP
jgi:hypothetical protein